MQRHNSFRGLGRVYFFQQVDPRHPYGGLIKIGFSKKPLEERLRLLSSRCGVPLIILATTAGNIVTERRLHKRFAVECAARYVPSNASRTEWFFPTERLLAYIGFLNRRAEKNSTKAA